MEDSARLRTRRLVLLFWILVIIFYFYLSYDYIRVRLNDSELNSYLGYVVQLAGNENRPAKEVRELILVRADELGLPLHGEQIHVSGERQNLKVSVAFSVVIQIPLLQRVIYSKLFEHESSYHQGL